MRRSTFDSALLSPLTMAALLTPGAQTNEVVGNGDVGAFKITGGGGSGNEVVLDTTNKSQTQKPQGSFLPVSKPSCLSRPRANAVMSKSSTLRPSCDFMNSCRSSSILSTSRRTILS